MDGVIVVVLDPRSLAMLTVAGVLPMVSYPFALPIEVWRRLTDDRSDSVAFALHAWFEANRTRVQLMDETTRPARVELGENAVLMVLTEDRRVGQSLNQEGRAAVLAVSSIDVFRALEASGLIHSADSVAAAAAEDLTEWRRSNAADPQDQARLKLRLFESLDVGVLSLA